MIIENRRIPLHFEKKGVRWEARPLPELLVSIERRPANKREPIAHFKVVLLGNPALCTLVPGYIEDAQRVAEEKLAQLVARISGLRLATFIETKGKRYLHMGDKFIQLKPRETQMSALRRFDLSSPVEV